MGGLFIDVLIGYFLRAISNWWKARGSNKWPSVQAIVTTDTVESSGYGGTKVDVIYSYRYQGELYTGMHTEPCFGSDSEDMRNRFPQGRTFVVRVKSDEPEISVLRDDDQTDGITQRLARIGTK